MVAGWGGRREDEKRRRKCEKEEDDDDKDEDKNEKKRKGKICSSICLHYPLAFIVKLLSLYGIPMTQY